MWGNIKVYNYINRFSRATQHKICLTVGDKNCAKFSVGTVFMQLWIYADMRPWFLLQREHLHLECPHWGGTHKEEDLGKLPLISIISATFFMTPFLVIELNTVYRYRSSWFKQYWNIIDMGECHHILTQM